MSWGQMGIKIPKLTVLLQHIFEDFFSPLVPGDGFRDEGIRIKCDFGSDP